MNKILFLTPMNPLGIGGGSFATHAYLRAFSDLYHGNVDILMADTWKDGWDQRVKVRNTFIAESLPLVNYGLSLFTGEIQRYSRVAKKILEEHPNDYSCVVSNGSSISGKLIQTTRKLGIKLITIHHNFEPEYFADNSKGLHRFLYLPIVRKLEKKAYQNSDVNLFLTHQDLEKFHYEYGDNNKKNAVIGVFEFEDYKLPVLQKHESQRLTFVITGSLCTMQGVDGILYFFKDLYQYLPSNANIIIAGRNPDNAVVSLCDSHKNVTLIPNPQDISEVIGTGNIYICPTRVGGGLKLRVMDGLKLGLPVITHTCSARGYDMFLETPYLKSFKDGREFKKAIDEILANIEVYSKEEIIERYRRSFSYAEGFKRLKRILEC